MHRALRVGPTVAFVSFRSQPTAGVPRTLHAGIDSGFALRLCLKLANTVVRKTALRSSSVVPYRDNQESLYRLQPAWMEPIRLCGDALWASGAKHQRMLLVHMDLYEKLRQRAAG
jgi:hypothetical protein